MLSQDSIETLSDLIQIRLSLMTISDQDDLRERNKLQRALMELQGNGLIGEDMPFAAIARRGRRRKVATLMSESA